jgi:hypothetical protein
MGSGVLPEHRNQIGLELNEKRQSIQTRLPVGTWTLRIVECSAFMRPTVRFLQLNT